MRKVTLIWDFPHSSSGEFFVQDWSATIDDPGGQSFYDQFIGDSEIDGKFEVGTDLVAYKWNEILLDVRNVVHQGHSDPGSGREVYGFYTTTNMPVNSPDPPIVFLWDHVFVTDEPYAVNYFHNDYLGSARVMTDDAANVIWRMDYYPFGGERSVTGTGNNFTYEGHEKDEESELWNNQARFFNEEGRFTEVDPLWMKYPSLSPYVRVANNPLKYVDPYGMEIRLWSAADAQLAADELNALHDGMDITVEEIEIERSFFGLFTWKSKYYRLSNKNSDFDWNTNKYTAALNEEINSEEIIFNVEFVDGSIKPWFGFSYYIKAGDIDAYAGGANVVISETENRVNDPIGVVLMHELVGHGYPVPGLDDPSDVNRFYRNKLGLSSRKYGIPHPSYMKIIGWE